MSKLPNSEQDRSYYGIPETLTACPCGVADCMYFSLGYPYCRRCDDHHRMPIDDDCLCS